ncbi:CYTH domain-containing protein [Paenibacillus sp. GD4]|uniref:CYTH domain-containing protein n=1 Tax=Paenibacillus sp. GD4 TaxID=3068890 RepID=UPI0027968D08|nr:CYTH domain-containing protein [Paenibacillus sp. GD4]MDQ1913032.1 CYTH domain-containing protein [Paenibacillus sp. GD4]
MNMEIERKYKLGRFPQEEIENGSLRLLTRQEIDQTYLAFSKQEEIRIRRLSSEAGETFTHTFKRGHGMSREEIEYSISSDIYEQLLGHSGKKPLRKTRTSLEADGLHFDIDEYEQFDLRVVEVEFRSEEEANGFQPPSWFGPEVGSEEEYRNKQLWIHVQNNGKEV